MIRYVGTFSLVGLLSCATVTKRPAELPAESARADSTLSQDEKPLITYCWIKKTLVNIRAEPSTNSEIIAQLPWGTKVVLLDEIESWFYYDENKINKWWKIKLLNEETIGYVYAPLATLDEVKHPLNCLVEKLLHPSAILDSHYQRYGLFWQVEIGSTREDALVYASNKWYDLKYGSRTIPGLLTAISEEAFLIWDTCLENNGYGRANSITIVSEYGVRLAKVHRNIRTGAIEVDFSQ